jgi:proteasome assembly chaperone (PAC2) family protein
MTLADGAIMFGACVLSFIVGYIIGAFRIGHYVNKRLDEIKGDMQEIEKHSRELRQFYAKIGEGDQP